MNALFEQILQMSMMATFVACMVMLLRLILKRAPKVFSYMLWSLVLFRMLLPFSIQSEISIIPENINSVLRSTQTAFAPKTTVLEAEIEKEIGQAGLGEDIDQNQALANADGNTGAIANSSTNVEEQVSHESMVLPCIWMLGITLMLCYAGFSYFKMRKKLEYAVRIRDNIYHSDAINTAFVLGFWKPRIYLPVGIDEEEMQYIVRHEETHIARRDYLIKPLAFFALALHWFNPILWIGYFLMTKDMELSCDERVLKEFGTDAKVCKDYATSLLHFSIKQSGLPLPLAFGESNVESRVKNVLRYKKPTIGVMALSLVLLLSACATLVSDPKIEPKTEFEFAEQYVEEMKESFSPQNSNFTFVDSKVTNLTNLQTFEDFFDYPVALWQLEYRLKPDDISKVVIAGGMEIEDDWLTEDSSMGKPYLLFSYESETPTLLGIIYHGGDWVREGEHAEESGMELEVRKFLENADLIERETFPGNHVVVEFPMSDGSTNKLLLSQPMLQGENGTWCVERWMDGGGNSYYEIIDAQSPSMLYYLSSQSPQEPSYLLNPLEVALTFVRNDLGQDVSLENLKATYDATLADFEETPISNYLGYLAKFEVDENVIHLDRVEWLTLADTERIEELNLDVNADMPSGFYIYNPKSYPDGHVLSEDTVYQIISYDSGSSELAEVTKAEFAAQAGKYKEQAMLVDVVTKDSYVQSITEHYVP